MLRFCGFSGSAVYRVAMIHPANQRAGFGRHFLTLASDPRFFYDVTLKNALYFQHRNTIARNLKHRLEANHCVMRCTSYICIYVYAYQLNFYYQQSEVKNIYIIRMLYLFREPLLFIIVLPYCHAYNRMCLYA